MAAVVITKEQMESVLNSGKRLPWWRVQHHELVAAWPVMVDDRMTYMEVLVYTSIDTRTNRSRGLGTDAIRVCLVDQSNGRGLGKTTYTQRTTGWSDRLVAKLHDMFIEAQARFRRSYATKGTEGGARI